MHIIFLIIKNYNTFTEGSVPLNSHLARSELTASGKWLKSDLLARLSWQKGYFQYNSAPTQSVQLARA